MHAILFYLTTFGHVDGEFDAREKEFVRAYIGRLIQARVDQARSDASEDVKADLVARWTNHFHEVLEETDTNVRGLFTEAVARDEDSETFVLAKLKLRCFEIFRGFDPSSQTQLLSSVDELIAADGKLHPAEEKFRRELQALLTAEVPLHEGELEEVDAAQVTTSAPPSAAPRVKSEDHPFFQRLERHYSRDPETLKRQTEADLALLDQAMDAFAKLRVGNEGKLTGKTSVDELAGMAPFLDGFTAVHMPQPTDDVELLVLGDLHGCYSCLKGALLQFDFFAKVQKWKEDPKAHPMPRLVLLGDYIDRGQFSFNGILRTVLQLFVTVPEHVVVLRGNHEYFLEYKGRIYGGVRPAEAIATLEPHAPRELFEGYLKMFEALPNVFLFDKMMFVHAGIPRDQLLAETWKDLSSLNDPDMRFQMLWSDPSEADYIPHELQKQNARFPFGRLQFRSFMARLGANTLVRGHEKVDAGWKKVYDDGVVLLFNLFSAGGADNDDLPPDSSYRSVTPMALTVRWKQGDVSFSPWLIDFQTYNDPERNAFFKLPPEIEFRSSQ